MAAVQSQTQRPLFFHFFGLRLLVYAAVLAGLLKWLMAMAAAEQRDATFAEGGTIETLQLAMLLLAAIIFALAAARQRMDRSVLIVAAALAAAAAMRELDPYLDQLLPIVGWQGPGLLLLALILVVVWKRRRELLDRLGPFAYAPAGVLAWAGFVTAALVAQIIGHGDVWRVISDGETRDSKRTIEELIECVGYTLLLCAAGESHVMRPPPSPAPSAP